jgi:hypothetical protein
MDNWWDAAPIVQSAGGAEDAGVMDDAARLQLQSSGMPVLSKSRDPLSRITDPKQRAMVQRQMLATGDRMIAKGAEGLTAPQNALQGLQEFEGINDRGVTGGFGGWLQSKLPSFLQTDDAQRAEQITTGLARANRIPGEGTISDFDARQFMRMTGGLDKGQSANAAYIKAAKAVQQSALDRQAFNEAFLQANGTMVGADTLWQQYARAVPLFDGEGRFSGRGKSWSQYYAERGQRGLKGERDGSGMVGGTRRGMIGGNQRNAPPAASGGWSIKKVD